MKPLMLHGHERSITQIKYNREGDLLFSSAKDNQPNVWYSINGERLGTFKGHNGAVWGIDVNWETTRVLTGSADNSCRLWDCATGVQLTQFDTASAVRTCGFSYSGHLLMYSTDKAMGKDCELRVYDSRDDYQMKNNAPMIEEHIPKESKITAAIWGPLDECIITGHEKGELSMWDIKTKSVVNQCYEHSKQVNDVQLSQDSSMILTASKDFTAKLFDLTTLDVKKVYKTERPINSASLSPTRPHVVMGGGQDAMDVTTTSTKIGKFDARFFHVVFEEEFGRVKGHFGPINSLAFHPSGNEYSSGGEDGYVRVHSFDKDYIEFDFEF